AHGGKPFARWWMHNGMLNFGGAKMSKSLGNIEKVHDLVRAHPPEALRYALLSAHYRQPLEWSDAVIDQSVRTLDRLYGTLRDIDALAAMSSAEPSKLDIPEEIEIALDDDLNTPAALSIIAKIASDARVLRNQLVHDASKADTLPQLLDLASQLRGAGLALGLLQQDPQAWFARGASGDDDARIQQLVDERNAAKKSRDFARADAIRDQLAAEGILLEDTPAGVRWKRA
ncbi:MAG: class I tRNA ligase family protein, partial [Proteobacteria bacterium]|nr:class I tRNA ligase family protein [Pseudomonadota bacterium]